MNRKGNEVGDAGKTRENNWGGRNMRVFVMLPWPTEEKEKREFLESGQTEAERRVREKGQFSKRG